MPAVLTHDFFGKDAYGPAMDYVDLVTPDERDAFILGNQGPDPLFYLGVFPKAPWDAYKDLGAGLHEGSPSSLLVGLRHAVDETPFEDQAVARAYAAGFVCHYLLDSGLHPLVYFWVEGITGAGVEGLDAGDGPAVHAEVERDLDEMVLWTKVHQSVETYRPYDHVLQMRDSALDTVGRLWADGILGGEGQGSERAEGVFPEAVRCFRRAQRALYLPGKARSYLISRSERHRSQGHYSLLLAMAHRTRRSGTSRFDNHEHLGWRNPFTGEVSRDSFWDIYDAALRRVPDALGAFFSEGFDEATADSLTGGLNFSGKPAE